MASVQASAGWTADLSKTASIVGALSMLLTRMPSPWSDIPKIISMSGTVSWATSDTGSSKSVGTSMSEALTTLGGTYALAGNYKLGISYLERALILRKGISSDPLESISIQMALATTLWDSKLDRPRAIKLAEEARAMFEAKGNAKMVKAVDDQLAGWRAPAPRAPARRKAR